MKREHIETLLSIAGSYLSDARSELEGALEDGDQEAVAELEEEERRWTEIRRELEVMTEEEPTSDIDKLREENILLRSILREMRDEVENIFEKRWLAR